ncbi:hypothetical protein [Comamonas antarctica]|uniref:hypothetical protein n=1 Tax=Comamonas antarctica TaxID=2743470 RepID=UPI0028EEDE5E|nr:hypothetical protein [Comamonas antarctica]
MQAVETSPTPRALIFSRHIIGMAIVALANPLIYYSNEPVIGWLSTWLVPLAMAGAAFALYAIFFTKHAKGAWPTRFFVLAWIFVVLAVAGPWINNSRSHQKVGQTLPPDAVAHRQSSAAYGSAHSRASVPALEINSEEEQQMQSRLDATALRSQQIKTFDDLDAAGIGIGYKRPTDAPTPTGTN